MGDVANFCNAFPNVEMAYEVQDSDEITAGDAVTLLVTLEREGEEDEDEPEGGWGKVGITRCDLKGGVFLFRLLLFFLSPCLVSSFFRPSRHVKLWSE